MTHKTRCNLSKCGESKLNAPKYQEKGERRSILSSLSPFISPRVVRFAYSLRWPRKVEQTADSMRLPQNFRSDEFPWRKQRLPVLHEVLREIRYLDAAHNVVSKAVGIQEKTCVSNCINEDN